MRLALSSCGTEEELKEAGQWACADNIKVFWIPIQPSLLLLAAQIKSKTQKVGPNLGAVTSLSKVWHLQDPPSPAEPAQKWPLPIGQPVGRMGTPSPSQTEASPRTSSTHQITNSASALKWLWLFRFRNITRPVWVILYLNYLNAIYPLKQFPLHRRSVFFFRELKHDK